MNKVNKVKAVARAAILGLYNALALLLSVLLWVLLASPLGPTVFMHVIWASAWVIRLPLPG
jgi:hypothetical protein